MILYFSTASTCLIDWKAPLSAAHQPYLVQLAYILEDDAGAVAEEVSAIARPSDWGFTIPDDTAALHGITQEVAEARGVAGKNVVEAFDAALRRASLVVGYGVDFHRKIMERAYILEARAEPIWPAKADAMRLSTDIVQAGTPQPGRGWKLPKLTEALQHFTGQGVPTPHDAAFDVAACRAIHHGILQHRRRGAA